MDIYYAIEAMDMCVIMDLGLLMDIYYAIGHGHTHKDTRTMHLDL